MAARPNILWLLSDQHRADVVGAAGHPVVSTPHLDALAGEGTLFSGAYCQGPLCMPSRASLLTGRHVRDHGVLNNKTAIADGLPTMVRAIRDAGYRTATIGKMHLYPHRVGAAAGLDIMRGYGFEEITEIGGKLASGRVRSDYTDHLAALGLYETYRRFVRQRAPGLGARAGLIPGHQPIWNVDPSPLPAADHIDSWVGDRAASWIDSVDDQRPWFCWVGFPGPHNPWDAPAEFVERYRDADVALDTTRRPAVPEAGPFRTFLDTFLDYSCSATLTDERIVEVRRHYFANVTLIDAAIGRIADALRRRGIDGNTWIVYSTDHGEMLGTHGLLNKMVFYEPSVRVPLIIRPPGGGQSRRFGGLIEHVDLTATLVEAAGGKPIPDSPGRSLVDLIAGPPAVHQGCPAGPDQPAPREGHLTASTAGREVVVSENFGFGMWRTDRYKLVVYEPERVPVQLFDLADDPGEDRNLVRDPARRAVVADLMDAYVRPFLAAKP